jgi:2-deoxy-D-gluconate 3-dehydrogenase
LHIYFLYFILGNGIFDMNLFDVMGKKAIVTGAAQGLAYGMAEGLMEAGVEVAIIVLSAF